MACKGCGNSVKVAPKVEYPKKVITPVDSSELKELRWFGGILDFQLHNIDPDKILKIIKIGKNEYLARLV